VVVIGFAPYSTASVLSARAAHAARADLIAIADSVSAPMAEGAEHVLLYEAASSPGFFPSLTGAIAIAQSLAAATFALGNAGARKRLEETEARLSATSQYVSEKG
jgi:DNA-binding MurR/RpiR family transcriptional regulator